MFARIAFAIPFGTAVTAGLFFMMNLMIESGSGEVGTSVARVVEFVRIERPDVVDLREERPQRPEAAEPVPDMPQPDALQNISSTLQLALAGPTIGLDTGALGGIGFEARDGEYLPIVKVAPVYPARALQRRLEGYVVVEFAVTASGAVRDVVVVESTSELFNNAAVEAAQKFKYQPRVIDGQTVEVSGVRNKITFKLDA